MVRFFVVLMVVLSMAAPSLGFAVEVAEGVITTGISNRAPMDQIQTYPASSGKLYAFTRVTGAEEGSSITHVWYKGDQEMARVELPVRSSDWRTWSSKTLLPEWTGEWKVVVLDGQGNELKTLPFTLN